MVLPLSVDVFQLPDEKDLELAVNTLLDGEITPDPEENVKTESRQSKIVYVKNMVCPICPRKITFQGESAWRRHWLAKHVTEVYNWPCNSCKVQCSRRSDLQVHMINIHQLPFATVYELLKKITPKLIPNPQLIPPGSYKYECPIPTSRSYSSRQSTHHLVARSSSPVTHLATIIIPGTRVRVTSQMHDLHIRDWFPIPPPST